MESDIAVKIWGVAFSGYDILLLILCPICGAFGAWVSGLMQKQKIAGEQSSVEVVKSNLNDIKEIFKHESSFRNNSNIDTIGKIDPYHLWRRAESRRNWVLGAGFVVIGLALGVVVSLYFMGAVTKELSAVTRVAGACILLGYQAPRIWIFQEKFLADIIEDKIRAIMSSEINNISETKDSKAKGKN